MTPFTRTALAAVACALTACLGTVSTSDAGTRSDDAGPGESPDAGTDAGAHPIIDAGLIDSTSCKQDGMTASKLALINLPDDTWYEVPNSKFGDFCDDPSRAYLHATDGCGAVIFAWSGGAYDSSHSRMLLFGGGHNDYWGNELWQFDVKTSVWSIAINPSVGLTASNQGKDPLDDGMPVSRHTYDGLQWVSSVNRLWAFGGASSPGGGGLWTTWMADPTQKTWTLKATSFQFPYEATSTYDDGSAYDPIDNTVVLKTINNVYLYDVATDTYTKAKDLGYAPDWPRYATGGGRGLVDTKRHLVWMLGDNNQIVYDPVANAFVTDDWKTTGGGDWDNSATIGGHAEEAFASGGGDIIKQHGPGADYDPVADSIVAWVGGGAYSLNLTTKVWSVGSAVGAPTAQVSNGTYGRFRYIARYNVFILVNEHTDNVRFYKHIAGCGRK